MAHSRGLIKHSAALGKLFEAYTKASAIIGDVDKDELELKIKVKDVGMLEDLLKYENQYTSLASLLKEFGEDMQLFSTNMGLILQDLSKVRGSEKIDYITKPYDRYVFAKNLLTYTSYLNETLSSIQCKNKGYPVQDEIAIINQVIEHCQSSGMKYIYDLKVAADRIYQRLELIKSACFPNDTYQDKEGNAVKKDVVELASKLVSAAQITKKSSERKELKDDDCFTVTMKADNFDDAKQKCTKHKIGFVVGPYAKPDDRVIHPGPEPHDPAGK